MRDLSEGEALEGTMRHTLSLHILDTLDVSVSDLFQPSHHLVLLLAADIRLDGLD